MSRNHQIGLIILIVLVGITNATLSVYNLQGLEQNDQSLLNIKYSIANYGFAPFGKTLIGRLVHTPQFGDECTPKKDSDVDYENSFLLIPRGKCEFVYKTLNAQNLGAQMAIIMDDKQHKGQIIMADNGYGYKVNIPSIFINFDQGQKLRKLLEEVEGDDDDEVEVLMKMTFSNAKTQKVDVNFYLQGNNRHSYRFIQNFRKYYPKIKDNINLNLIYYTKECKQCTQNDCYNNKQYCAFNYIHQESAKGQQILDQQIRELILFEQQPDKWWTYMKYVADQCSKISELNQCQINALKKIDVNVEQFTKKFDQSFKANKENIYLQKNKEKLQGAGINKYPAVTLNTAKLRGNLHAEFVFDDICNTLIDPPKQCKKYIDTKIHEEVTSIQWPTLVLVVALGVLIFSLIFCLYRRFMKKKISGEMQGRVDDMVSKYIEFYSERNK